MLIKSEILQAAESQSSNTGIATINGKTGIYTKEEILDRINYFKSIHKTFSPGEIFRQIANGMFQAEGSVTGKFLNASSHYLQPQLSISQNVSDSSIIFMVTLYYALSEKGSIRVSLTSGNKWNISLVTESWKNIFETWIPYFNQVTGAKYCAFQILVKLQHLNTLNTSLAAWESIHLAYSLSGGFPRFKMSLKEKLSAVTLISDTKFGPVSLPGNDNPVALTFPFFFGLYLGDGYASVRLRTTETSLLVIPVLSIGQKLTTDSVVLMNRLSKMLSTLGVKVQLNEVNRTKEYSGVSYDASTVVLTIEGLANLFDCLLPLLLTLKEYWYWKEDQLNVFSIVEKYYAIKAHRLIAGLTNLVLYLFSIPKLIDNDRRTVTLSSCLDAIKNMEETKNNRANAGHYMIASEFDSSGVLAYRVRFPSFMFEGRKSYIFTTSGNDSAKVLETAVAFRDSTINSWLKDKLAL